MKAVVYETYGPPEVLKPVEVEKPVPGDDEILVKVYATTVNYGDIMARNFGNISPSDFNMPFLFWLPAKLAFGLKKPKIKVLGSEFAGEVAEVGRAVTRFKTGDRVYGYCGMSMGAYAEYLCVPENGTVALKPSNMSFEEAATIPYGAVMASGILRKANIEDGQSVLVIGASGGIGSHVVRLARQYGARVTGVCGTPRLEYVKSLGAEKVIDYMKGDFTENNATYDVVMDILGRSSFSRCAHSLAPHGCYLLASFKMRQLIQMAATSLFGKKKVVCVMVSERREDLDAYRELIEAEKIATFIDRIFPLEKAAAAHRYVEEGNHKGPVVVTVGK